MLLFRSEEAIDRWCQVTGEPRGEAVGLQQVWKLSQFWYGNRMDPAYRGRNAEQVAAIFNQAGLTSEFWRV